MKTIDWYKFLESQRTKHTKVLFRVAELANVAGRDSHALNVELRRLVQKGIVVRYAAGVYGLPGQVTVEQLVPALDSGAYITGMYALYRHNLITQAPTEVTCFTNRRHNRSRQRNTPLGRLVFVCAGRGIYRKPRRGSLASPEQALIDWVHLLRKRGVAPTGLVTFRNRQRYSRPKLAALLQRYPPRVAEAVNKVMRVEEQAGQGS